MKNMKRLWVCIFLIVAMTSASCGSLAVLNAHNEKLFAAAQKVEDAYNNGGDTMAEVEKLSACWGEYYVSVSYVANTDTLNSISSGVFRLRYLLENDSDEFLSELHSICSQIRMLYNSQFPHLYSVL